MTNPRQIEGGAVRCHSCGGLANDPKPCSQPFHDVAPAPTSDQDDDWTPVAEPITSAQVRAINKLLATPYKEGSVLDLDDESAGETSQERCGGSGRIQFPTVDDEGKPVQGQHPCPGCPDCQTAPPVSTDHEAPNLAREGGTGDHSHLGAESPTMPQPTPSIPGEGSRIQPGDHEAVKRSTCACADVSRGRELTAPELHANACRTCGGLLWNPEAVKTRNIAESVSPKVRGARTTSNPDDFHEALKRCTCGKNGYAGGQHAPSCDRANPAPEAEAEYLGTEGGILDSPYRTLGELLADPDAEGKRYVEAAPIEAKLREAERYAKKQEGLHNATKRHWEQTLAQRTQAEAALKEAEARCERRGTKLKEVWRERDELRVALKEAEQNQDDDSLAYRTARKRATEAEAELREMHYELKRDVAEAELERLRARVREYAENHLPALTERELNALLDQERS